MKPFKIALIAVLANLILLLALLSSTTIQNLNHLADINWFAFGPIDLLYAIIVASIGWLMGSFVNGLLVYPKRRSRNYWISQINIGIIFFLLAVYFSWSTGSFETEHHHTKHNPGYVDITKPWSDSSSIYRNVVNRGLHAF